MELSYQIRIKKIIPMILHRRCLRKYYSDYLKFYKSNFIFLDIGSNIGLYSCIASKIKIVNIFILLSRLNCAMKFIKILN